MSFCHILLSRCSPPVFPFARRNWNGSEAPRLHVQDAWQIRHSRDVPRVPRVAKVARLCSPHCWARSKPWIRFESRRYICTLQSRRRSPSVLRSQNIPNQHPSRPVNSSHCSSHGSEALSLQIEDSHMVSPIRCEVCHFVVQHLGHGMPWHAMGCHGMPWDAMGCHDSHSHPGTSCSRRILELTTGKG